MRYSIVYSPNANRDLDRVWADVYEASKESEVANRYVIGMMDAIAAKNEFPQSGTPLYYEGSYIGYYYVVFKAYIAFYRIEDDRIYVDRILFGKSDYLRTLFRINN